jgi:hypothetical protein
MLTAVGTGAQRNEDGSVTVAVTVQRDGATLKDLKLTGRDLANVQAQLRAQLTALAASLDDVSLSDAVVGKVLAQV